MVEFVIVAPILLLLVFGIIQFGILFNNYVTLTDAVRAGARQAAVSRTLPDPVGTTDQPRASRRQPNLDTSRASSTSRSTRTTRTTAPIAGRRAATSPSPPRIPTRSACSVSS